MISLAASAVGPNPSSSSASSSSSSETSSISSSSSSSPNPLCINNSLKSSTTCSSSANLFPLNSINFNSGNHNFTAIKNCSAPLLSISLYCNLTTSNFV